MKPQLIAEQERVAANRDPIVLLLGVLLGLCLFGYVVFLVFGYFDPPKSPFAPRTDAWLLRLYLPPEWLRHLGHLTR